MPKLDKERKIISFLGLPASGKGTQAEILARKLNARVFGIGDIVREEVEHADLSDPFHKSMKERYDKGILLQDEIIADIIRRKVKSEDSNIVFDNFPFSKNQTAQFFEICKELNISNPMLIIVNISKAIAKKRILSRKICSSCKKIYLDESSQICESCGGALITRSDDNQEVLADRISQYLPRLDEVKEEFKKHGLVVEINGEPSIPEVTKEIDSKLFYEST